MNSFDNNQAAKLRNAIQSTTSALAVLTASGALQTALQTHLAELLVRERALFGCDTEAKPVTKDTPWYPDDSGKWIEVPPGTRALPPGLDPNALIEVLTYGERQSATHAGLVRPAKGWLGLVEHIAAYRVVATAAKADPWYPDDSDQWVEVPPGTRALPPRLDPNCLSEVLTSTERRTATYIGQAYPSEGWSWHGGHIVAYKIVAPAAKDAPWYPDDSGKWVEVTPGSGFPKGLDLGTTVEVLVRGERIAKSYKYWARPAGSWYWLHEWWRDGTIVAYKIVD